jgi:hypothetical protein
MKEDNDYDYHEEEEEGLTTKNRRLKANELEKKKQDKR